MLIELLDTKLGIPIKEQNQMEEAFRIVDDVKKSL